MDGWMHGWMDGPWVRLLTLRSKLPLMAQDRQLVIELINHLGFIEPTLFPTITLSLVVARCGRFVFWLL
jgi:hypothetical protein